MSALRAPIHTGAVNGYPVRFFKTPIDDGMPDFPWHACEDLMSALGLDRAARRMFRRATKGFDADKSREIATASGIVTIAPHFQAQGLIGAMTEMMRSPDRAEIDYATQVSEAMRHLTGDLPMEASLKFMISAFHRWSDASADAREPA